MFSHLCEPVGCLNSVHIHSALVDLSADSAWVFDFAFKWFMYQWLRWFMFPQVIVWKRSGAVLSNHNLRPCRCWQAVSSWPLLFQLDQKTTAKVKEGKMATLTQLSLISPFCCEQLYCTASLWYSKVGPFFATGWNDIRRNTGEGADGGALCPLGTKRHRWIGASTFVQWEGSTRHKLTHQGMRGWYPKLYVTLSEVF